MYLHIYIFIYIYQLQATAIIIINNEPGIDHLPGPDAHDISFSVSSIPMLEGQLLEIVYDEVRAYIYICIYECMNVFIIYIYILEVSI
jgi:hypothetical protein